MTKRITWTIEPDKDVQSLIKKQINRICGVNGGKRGARTRLINQALRIAYGANTGKRELSFGELGYAAPALLERKRKSSEGK